MFTAHGHAGALRGVRRTSGHAASDGTAFGNRRDALVEDTIAVLYRICGSGASVPVNCCETKHIAIAEVIVMTIFSAGGMRLPGIGRSVNGRLNEREGTTVVPESDGERETGYQVSYIQVTGLRHPFGIRIRCNPWELPDRIRTKLKCCASIFLRRCGRLINHAPADPEKEIRQDEKAGSHAAAYRSLWHHEERES